MAPSVSARPFRFEPGAELVLPLGPEHFRLRRLCGGYVGMARTHLGGGERPHDARWDGVIVPVLDGRFVRYDYVSAMNGGAFPGFFLFGFDRVQHRYVASWVDRFHTAGRVVRLEGDPQAKEISLTGAYYFSSRGENWGWRVAVEEHEVGRVRMGIFNISPMGKETTGVELILRRSDVAR